MKKNTKTTTEFVKTPAVEHGQCPTCGHCKCCEKKAAAPIYFPIYLPPICTRRHYPDYSPTPFWYDTTTANPQITTTAHTGTVWAGLMGGKIQ